jgi:thymidine kinase
MFLENSVDPNHLSGWIEVITGSMFSGKTEELLRRLRRAKLANQKVEIFKPKIDNRYAEAEVVSHDENSIFSTVIGASSSILLLTNDVEVVGIDEAQFFDEELPQVCNKLANAGMRVIVAGLDMDFKGKPFGMMPQLLASAEYVTKVHAICMRCGNLAHYSHRKSEGKEQMMLGAQENYEPLCRQCYHKIFSSKQ